MRARADPNLQTYLIAVQAPPQKPCSSPVHPHRPQFSLNHFEEYRRNPAKYTGALVQGIQKSNKVDLLETHLCHHQAAKNTTADQDLSRIPTRTDHNFSRPQFFQAPAEGISKGPCKTLLLSRLQHKSLVAPQYTRTDHNFPSITSKNIEGTLRNTQVLLYRASKL